MTSGEFRSVPIPSIWVNREERQRKKLTKVPELADKIRRVGLIHPLVIKRDFELIAGERRLEAVKLLGWTHVSCQYLDEADPYTRKQIELEENISRVDLTDMEQCCAIADYHNLRREEEEKWTQEDTAEALGIDQTSVSYKIEIARRYRQGDPRITNDVSLSTARGIIDRDARRKNARTNRIHSRIDEGVAELFGEEPAKFVLNEDFIKWAESYTGDDKFNFIHCDFPYGINTDKRQQGNAVAIQGGYDDSADIYWRLLGALCKNLNRFCDKSAHIMFWFSMHNYQATIDYFHKHTDFRLDPFPLIWHKSDGKSLLPDPNRGPRRVYETALFGSRGDRPIVQAKANACSKPTDSERHISTKPAPVLRHFFEMFVDENSTVLDPSCGSGTALSVAKELDAANILGFEINPDCAADAELLVAGTRHPIRRDATAAL